ncbi:hypothetical protein ACFL35_15890 [Candidatus Riflebacteria bacterium]
MLKRIKEKLLLKKKSTPPFSRDMEIIGVFNPAAVRYKDEVILLARVVHASTKLDKEKYCCLRSYRGDDEKVRFEEFWANKAGSEDHYSVVDEDGYARLKFISHLEIVRLSKDGYELKSIKKHEQLFGLEEYEEWGIEDPRITKIDDIFYITYVAVSRKMGIVTCLMRTRDFQDFERLGIIFPASNKDVVIFPEQKKGKYLALHRPTLAMKTRNYAILGASSTDLIHWGAHEFVMECSSDKKHFDSLRLGAGCPPIKTEKGWLHIFHGVMAVDKERPNPGLYQGGAFITSFEKPFQVTLRCEEPVLRVEKDYEKSGYVDRVVFPTGVVRDLENPDHLHIYYGCADENIAVVTLSVTEIMETCKPVLL